MVRESYCSFEVAKLLKEKGFIESCYGRYSIRSKEFHFDCTKVYNNGSNFMYSAPTHQMAMAWLREVYNICITIYPDKENGYEAVLYNIKDDVEIILQSFGIYGYHIFEDSYEEAVEAALSYCLTNLI